MQSSDSLKEQWTFKGRLQHAKNMFEAYRRKYPTTKIEDLPTDLADALGWQKGKLVAFIAIAESPILTASVEEYPSCTYKGWLHLLQVAKVLKAKYQMLMEELTGVDHTKESEYDEAVYKLLVNKIKYYVGATGANREKVKKAQPGSLIERCAPVLRRGDFPAARVRDWLTKNIDLTPNGVERFTEHQRRATETKKFIRAYMYAPAAKENELKQSIQRISDTDVSKEATNEPTAAGNVEAETANVVADDTPPAPTDKKETRKTSKVKEHQRSQPDRNTDKNERTFVISLSGKKKEAFGQIATQLMELLQKAEVCDGFSATEKTLAHTVVTILDSGIKRAKSA
jgi:hypothetical protein